MVVKIQSDQECIEDWCISQKLKKIKISKFMGCMTNKPSTTSGGSSTVKSKEDKSTAMVSCVPNAESESMESGTSGNDRASQPLSGTGGFETE